MFSKVPTSDVQQQGKPLSAAHLMETGCESKPYLLLLQIAAMGLRPCGLFCLHCCMIDSIYICGRPFVFSLQESGVCFPF